MKLDIKSIWMVVLIVMISICSHAEDWPTTERDCLAANIYHEARGESVHGQWFVAYVTQNRVNDRYYPGKYCQVIKQYKQFSWWDDPKIVKKPNDPEDPWSWVTACDIARHFMAKDAISQHDASMGALFYHKYTIHPYWADDMEYIGRVGKHLAYRRKG